MALPRPTLTGTARTAHAGTILTPCAAAMALALVACTGAAGQVIRGGVFEVVDGTRQPVPGAVVRLITADSQHVDMILSSRDGTYLLTAPRPGRYRLQVQHVAFLTTHTPAVTIPSTGSVTHNVTLTRRPLRAERATRPRSGPPCEQSEPRCRAAASLRAKRANLPRSAALRGRRPSPGSTRSAARYG